MLSTSNTQNGEFEGIFQQPVKQNRLKKSDSEKKKDDENMTLWSDYKNNIENALEKGDSTDRKIENILHELLD